MIGSLARKRTNVVALATLLALVAAMFTVMPSARAAIALGDCTADTAEAPFTNDLGNTDSCDIPGTTSPDAVADSAELTATTVGEYLQSSDDEVVTISGSTVTAADFGTATVTHRTVVADGPDEGDDPDVTDVVYLFEVHRFEITKIDFGDSDNTVRASATTPLTVTVTASYSPNAQSDTAADGPSISLTVPAPLAIVSGEGRTATRVQTASAVGDQVSAVDGDPATDGDQPSVRISATFLVSTAGVPTGDYTVTASADSQEAATGRVTASDTETLTVTDDAGAGLGSATLSLGNVMDDNPATIKDETIPESGTVLVGGKINLVVQAFNSLGSKSNPGDVSEIQVIAGGGRVDFGVTGVTGNVLREEETGERVGQTVKFSLSKANSKPGTVDVYALVIGPGTSITTETVTLTFSGTPTGLSVADATEALLAVNEAGADDDTVKLEVTATDDGGNKATPPTRGVRIVITGPDDKSVLRSKIDASQPTKSGTKYYITLTGKGTQAAPLAAGEYTVTVSQGELEDTATFNVAGAAANIELAVDNTSPGDDDAFVTATATVTDKDGNSVSDGTEVTFGASGNGAILDLVGNAGKMTKDGVATATFVVIGDGRSVISAISGSGKAATTVNSTAGAADTAEAEEVTLGCLSETSGFATYTCDTASSASELFALVSGRGATAIHLWNGSAWVRYSVVNGNEVPGSTDFLVTDNDILYVSN